MPQLLHAAACGKAAQGQLVKGVCGRRTGFGNDVHTELSGLRGQSGMGDAVLGHHACQVDVGNALVMQECLQAGFVEAVCLPLADHWRIAQGLRDMRMKAYTLAVRAEKRGVRS